MKRESGITLIALVITIIVLLILAGVSISMLTGENGILSKAQSSAEQTKIAEYKEKLNLIVTEHKMDAKIQGFTATLDTLNKRLQQEDWILNTSIKAAQNCIQVVVKDQYVFEVSLDNGVIFINKSTEPFAEVEIKFEKNGEAGKITVNAKESKSGILNIKLVETATTRTYSDSPKEKEEKFDIIENGKYTINVTAVNGNVSTKTINIDELNGEAVAKIGTVNYNTLNEAINSVKESENTKIEILRNFTQSTIVEISKNKEISLDLRGYKVTMPLYINNKGKLHTTSTASEYGTIDGVSATTVTTLNSGELTLENTNLNTLTNAISNSGTLIIKNGNIKGNKSFYTISNNNNGKIIIQEGNIVAESASPIYNASTGSIQVENANIKVGEAYAIYNKLSGSITINGGNFESAKSSIWNEGTGNVQVNGGKFNVLQSSSGLGYNAINNAGGGAVTISNAEITSVGNAILNTNNSSTTINSGTFTGFQAVLNSAGTVNIKNGVFKGTHNTSEIQNQEGTMTIDGGVTSKPISNNAKGTLIVNGGDLKGLSSQGNLVVNGGNIEGTGSAIYVSGTGTAQINNGNLTSKTSYVVQNSGTQNVTIKGGTLKADFTESSTTYPNVYNYSTGSVSIEGGTIDSKGGALTVANRLTGSINISGGTISGDSNVIKNGSTGNITISGANITGIGTNMPAIVNSSGGTITMKSGNVRCLTSACFYNTSTGNIIVESGVVKADNYAAIYNSGTGYVTAGIDDGTISKMMPDIYSPNTNYTIVSPTFNFFDGIIRGGFLNKSTTNINMPPGKNHITTSGNPDYTTLN